ncbi:hypothetical protein DOM22_10910 [Bdellovibrio sp. ZAP7]|nr:hypothetical protein DOM22_10910 [Bdellovibrio sp. ZAP7]
MQKKFIILNLFWFALVIASNIVTFDKTKRAYESYDHTKGMIDTKWEIFRRIEKFSPVTCKLDPDDDPNLLFSFKDTIVGVKTIQGNTYQFCIDDLTPVIPEITPQ